MASVKIIHGYVSKDNAPVWMLALQDCPAVLLPGQRCTLVLEQLSMVATPVIPALGRLRQGDCSKLKDGLDIVVNARTGYRVRLTSTLSTQK